MRKVLSILFLFASIVVMAGKVTPEEALKKAQTFMKSRTNKLHQMHLAAKSSQLRRAAAQNSQENYYVFNVGENDGYVMVSGDDRTPAILGYAGEGSFDANRIPANMKAWLQGYDSQLEYLASHPTAARAAIVEHQAIKPLIKTTWDQEFPYNNMCPMVGKERCLTGCVATAMAQILAYYKYPAKTTDTIPSYTTETKGFLMDSLPPTTIDWDHILNNYTGNETEAEKNAIANLMLLCGVALEMDYDIDFSGSYTSLIADALKAYFDFDDATRYVKPDNYSAGEWDAIIYNELVERRPVAYSGNSSHGAHAFVVDGYDKDGLYHVNWGWGGYSNGYFLLSILNPYASKGGFSFDQDAVIGMQPNTGEVSNLEKKMTTDNIFTSQTSQTTVLKTNGVFPISYVSDSYNYTGGTVRFEMGTGVYNTRNELVYSELMYEEELEDYYGIADALFECNIPSLPDGTYLITNISREKGSTTWLKNEGSDKYNLTAIISGDTMRLQTPFEDLNFTISTTGNMRVGSRLTVKTTIENKGTYYANQLFLLVNGEIKGGQVFEVEAGETKTIEMDYWPKEAGKNTISIAQRSWIYHEEAQEWVETYPEFATTTVTITEADSYALSFSNGKVQNAIDGKINDNVAVVSFTVMNDSTNTYNDDLCIYSLVKPVNADYFDYDLLKAVPVMLTAKQSQEMQVEIPLERDGTYKFVVVYRTNGEFIDEEDKGCLPLASYQVVVPEVPDPIELGVEAVKTVKTPQVIYNLNGQKVNKARKGLFIINGRKVVMK